jgi:hypothetical protein
VITLAAVGYGEKCLAGPAVRDGGKITVRKLGIFVTILVLAAISAWGAASPALAANGDGPSGSGTALVPQIQGPPGPPPTSGTGIRIQPDVSGYNRCEKGGGPLWTAYFKDRFHSCFLVHTGFDVVVKKDGVNVVVGNWTLLWIVSGAGYNSGQLMTFTVKSTLWKVIGVPPGPTWRWSVGLGCLNYFGSTCNNNHSTGYTYDVAEWSLPHTFTFLFNTSKSPGYTPDKYYNADDGLNYHAMSQWQMFPGNQSSKSWSNPVYFRGDKAPYARGVGGSVFYQVIPTWKISLSGNAAAVAKHIQTALTKPGSGYPPPPKGKTVRIPGSVATGQPLMRLYPDYDQQIYDNNRSTAIAACVAHWGSGYANGGKDQCDEYPMAATYEGASQANGNPWWYSVQVLSQKANSSAGGSWVQFLNNNRVLSGDPFWVAVVS